MTADTYQVAQPSLDLTLLQHRAFEFRIPLPRPPEHLIYQACGTLAGVVGKQTLMEGVLLS